MSDETIILIVDVIQRLHDVRLFTQKCGENSNNVPRIFQDPDISVFENLVKLDYTTAQAIRNDSETIFCTPQIFQDAGM